jgi:hypothetical protein
MLNLPAQSLSVNILFLSPIVLTAAVLLVITTRCTLASKAAFKTFNVPLKKYVINRFLKP